MLAAFSERVRAAEIAPVADIGCGPGDVTARLRNLGLTDVFGVDLSPEMVAIARRAHPDLRFDEGSMTALDIPDSSLAGAVAWYSIIHVPPGQLADVFAEFHRVLVPGGHLLLAFQVGDHPLHVAEPFGQQVSLDFLRLLPDRVAEMLSQAGIPVEAQLLREPDGVERVPQAFLIARKSAES
ncbi:class I SAM-dependent methyltransferase [Nocardiopsis gilva YIM 90087]|uniref:Class I SAM-dependent methyltransferase n=2 Tax=Nocardiopsis gilva TaxID=280236 RepID=A0A223SD47_9ACTN|nr:class I SAM-dependent methyltransferase [Nocardiopsis gilva YIM 90087]